MNRKTKNNVIEILILIVFLIIFILSIIYQKTLESLISQEILIYGLITFFIVSFLLDLIPQYVTPYLLFIQAKILGFPTILTFALIIIGALLGALVGFKIGKKYGIKVVKKLYNGKKYNKIKKKVRKYGKWVMALAAISPLPYVPIIFGSLGIKNKEFWIFGILPRLLGLIIFALGVGFF